MTKRLFIVALMLASMLFAKSSIDSKARWIWYPEQFGEKTTNASRYARVVFHWEKTEGEKATFFYRADDSAVIWFNGHKAAKVASGSTNGFTLTDFLEDGRNVLCVEIRNGSGPGGLIGHLAISAGGKTKLDVFTNKSWKISRTADSGWLDKDFDDSGWAEPLDMGNTLTAPWAETYNCREIYDDAEREVYYKEKKMAENKMTALNKRLEAEPELTVTTEVLPDTNPKFVLNGRKVDALLYGAPYAWPYDSEKTQEKIENFHRGGLDLYFLGIESDCWNADGSINEKQIHDRLYNALLLNPDAYLIFAINLNGSTKWWMDANPDELMDYGVGGVNLAEKDPVNNVRSPSYASLKWRKDGAEYLRKVVNYVESLPIGKRVISYRVDFGVYREWHYLGMRSHMPGTCKRMEEAFRRYLGKKYGTDEALQKAWNDNAVTIDTAKIPGVDERNASIDSLGTLRDPVENAAVIDFLHTMQGEMRDLVIAWDTAIKEACGYRKLVGNYHGYLFGMHYPVEAWHLENEEVLASGVVDWQSAPDLYSNREVDDAEFGRSPVESHRLRGKIQIQEHDSRTHLAVEETYHRHVYTPAQSVTTLSRDLAQTLCRNAGCWFMDFTRHWYNDPQILAFFRKIKELRDLAAKGNKPVSRVAVVADLESVYYNRISTTNIDLMLDCNAQELTHTGTPFDVLLVSDLANPNVRDYQVYVMANLFYLTPEKRAIIEKLRQAGKSIVWLYAPGYLDANGHSVDGIRDLTGFAVTEKAVAHDGCAIMANGGRMTPFSDIVMGPSFGIVEKDITPLAWRNESRDEITFASRRNGDALEYYSTTGFLSRDAWKAIFRENGIHCYENSGTAVIWATDSFVSINGKAGKYTITLPEERTVTEMLPEKCAPEKKSSIEVELTEEIGMKLFHLE